ncbi:MAG TPA: nuclear transport factor 2 family protein [Kofleriaceae bacterium]|nr:nuclear transport factor 2 family protein [Kofleriaceae bacterium]
MSDLKQLDDELNQMIATGRGFPDGFDKFYADDVVMVEAAGEECKGKEANRRREIEFLGSIAEFHGVNLVASAVGDGVSFSEWEFDLTFVGGGSRVKMQQVARRRWKDGKVVHERFYYNA